MFEISDAKINKKKYSTKDTIDKALQTKLLQKSTYTCILIKNTDKSLIIYEARIINIGYLKIIINQ